MMRSSICALTVLACAGSAAAFAPTAALPLKATSRSALLSRGIRRSSQAPLSGLKAQLSPQDVQALSDGAMHLAGILPQGFVDGSTSYFNLFVPMIKAVGLPPFLQTWFHGMNMGTVLVAMGGYGAYLGWSIRQNNQIAEELAPGPAWANLGKTNGDLHKTLMSVMGLIFFLGANGGLCLALVQGKPIMESAHFTTAMAGFTLLAMQGALSTRFKSENASTARTTHAFLGSATMGVFFYHAFLGFQLGLEYAAPAVVAMN